jgi:plastocyanin
MRQAIIILLIIVFSFSTIGMYIAAGGGPTPQQQQADVRSQQSSQNSDLPSYLRTGEPNIRGTVDATDQSKVEVTIGDNFFNPTVLRVSQGVTVTWRNQGKSGHSIKSDRGSPRSGLDSGTLQSGEAYSYTFEEPGVYNYYSQSNSTAMRAVIEVKR